MSSEIVLTKYTYPENLLILAQIDIIYEQTIENNNMFKEYIVEHLKKLDEVKCSKSREHLSKFAKEFYKLGPDNLFEKVSEELHLSKKEELSDMKSFQSLKNDPEALKFCYLLFIKCNNRCSRTIRFFVTR